MKNIFIICFSIFISNAFAGDVGKSYIITNSTDHDIKVTANFWKEVSRYPLQVVLPPSTCLRIRDHYHYRENDYTGHMHTGIYRADYSFVTKWVFVPDAMSLLIDDGSAYESFRGLDLFNYEVTGKTRGLLGFIDTFQLSWNSIPNSRNNIISGSCKIFVPGEALFVGGDGNTELHDSVFASDHERVDHLLRNGAEVNLRNKDGKTSLEIARQQEDAYMISILKGYGAEEKSPSNFISGVNQ